MSDYEVSEVGCHFWNTGLYCRAGATTGCPNVHDNYLRKEALTKKRQDNLKKKTEQNLAVSRTTLQTQYNNVLASKTSNIPRTNKAKQLTSIKRTDTAEVNSRIESIINQTDREIQRSADENLDSSMTSSMIAKINNVKVNNVTVTKFETTYRLSWATVIYSKPNSLLASKFPKINSRVCKFFLNTGSCRKGDRCNYSHYVVSPTNPQAPWPSFKPERQRTDVHPGEAVIPPHLGHRLVSSPPMYSWDVLGSHDPVEVHQPKEAYVATAHDDVVATTTKAQHSKSPSEASASALSPESVNSSQKTWESVRRASTTETQPSDAERWALATQKIGFIEPEMNCVKAPDTATFHGFSNLPAELRLKIWGIAMKDYRQTARLVHKWDNYHMGTYYGSRLAPQNPSPSFLRINKEAREIAGHYHFTKSFGTMFSGPETWFNFENDRLFLQTESALRLVETAQLILPRERKLIRYIQLPLRDFIHHPTGFTEIVTGLHNLKSVFLIASDDPEDWHWTRNPRMCRQVRKAIEKDWFRRQEKYHPNDVRKMPDIWIDLVGKDVAKAYGVDGICWGNNVYHDERLRSNPLNLPGLRR